DPGHTARLLEDTMSHPIEPHVASPSPDQDTPVRRRSPLAWLVAAAAVLVIAGVGAFAVFSGDGSPSVPVAQDPAATVMELSARPPSTAKCLVVSPAALQQQQVAFDGTVASITDGLVTLDVGHWYLGGNADQVTVQAPAADLQALVQAADFKIGERYLVSATDGSVSVCGFTAPYSADLAAMYEQAFGA
ncbi:MAG: hypothetical protein ABIO16_13275, partial [Nocardioides sp.]